MSALIRFEGGIGGGPVYVNPEMVWYVDEQTQPNDANYVGVVIWFGASYGVGVKGSLSEVIHRLEEPQGANAAIAAEKK